MFFPKLRRRAKWVFLVLAVFFGGGFLIFGVGTGAGSGIGDYFADLLNRPISTQGPALGRGIRKANPNHDHILRHRPAHHKSQPQLA